MTHPVSVIVAGARTPMGRFRGGLSSLQATDLGACAIRGAVEKAGVQPDQVEYLIMGHVLQAGAGQNPARTAGLAAGLPPGVPSITINKVCLSGLNAIAMADQLIRAGEAEVIVAGGMESMSNVPHLLASLRGGTKYGDAPLVDSLAYDGLFDQATQQPMGALAEAHNVGDAEVSRGDQDAFAVRSHAAAAAAAAGGLFAEEIVAVTVPQRRGEPIVISADEGVRAEATLEGLAGLPAAFVPGGTITAGSSSPISDGAAAVVVMSKSRAEELGVEWLAEITAHGMVAGPDSSLQMQPANATLKALGRAGLTPSDLDLVEFNEAFAAVGVASTRALGLDPEIVNVNGGAIALGHPLGASGARIVLHLAHELRRRGGGVGAAALCGGGGQGDALVISAPSPIRSMPASCAKLDA